MNAPATPPPELPLPPARPPTVIILRAEAAVLLDHMPEWLASTGLTDWEREMLEALHTHLVRFFTGRAHN